jgi:hypothetical protein
MTQVIAILHGDPDNWNASAPFLAAVAESEEAAKRWIADETEGRHESGHRYMTGKSPDWWIDYGVFILKPVEVQT